MKEILFAFALVAAAGGARPAAAFSQAGHRTIAVIAQDRLSAQALAKVRSILGDGVSLEQISTCADDIKRNPLNCAGVIQLPARPETSGWHFVDDPTTDNPTGPELQNYCQGDDCVVDEIKDQLKALTDPSATRYQQQVALMFVVHLVGDLFQPMHCVTEIIDGSRSDFGGNAEPFPTFATPQDKYPMNLHHLWDNLIQTDAEEYATDPNALAKQLESGLPAAGSGTRFTQDDIAQAALDSHSIAKQTIYPDYAANHGKTAQAAYQAQMQPIIYARVQKSGAALGDLLETALDSMK